MELYQITRNEDTDAGAGRTIFMNLYFTTKSAAKTFVESRYYADSYGVQGYKGNDYDIKTVKREDVEPKIYASIADYQEKTNIDINLTSKQNKDRQLENMSKEELIELIKGMKNERN